MINFRLIRNSNLRTKPNRKWQKLTFPLHHLRLFVEFNPRGIKLPLKNKPPSGSDTTDSQSSEQLSYSNIGPLSHILGKSLIKK